MPTGYQMAKNLRTKIEDSDTLTVYDVNPGATKKLQEEAGKIDVAQNVREVAEKAVRRIVVVFDCFVGC